MRKEVREKYPHLYEKNYEKAKEAAKNYYRENKERIKNRNNTEIEVLERRRKASKEWYKNNKLRISEYIEQYRSTALGMLYQVRSRCKDRGWEPPPKENFVSWFVSQEKKCCYCGLTEEETRMLPTSYTGKRGKKRLTVDRKNNLLRYEIENLALCCYVCNTIKNSFLSYEDMLTIGELVLKPKVRSLLNEHIS